MPCVTFEGQAYELESGETVLECLLRHGLSVPYSCQAGVCQTCTMTAVDGVVPAIAQASLLDTHQQRGDFLPCICLPQGDLHIVDPDSELNQVSVTVTEHELLSPTVLRLRMHLDGSSASFQHRAGQFLTIVRSDGVARPYSIASLEQDGFLETHVRRVQDGAMSNWLHDEVGEGDLLTVQGPKGDCFYAGSDPEQPLLLAGTGTGLAPLWGILRDAVTRGHRGPIHLFHAAGTAEGLYLVDEVAEFAAQHSQVTYTPVVRSGPAPEGGTVGDLLEVTADAHPDLRGWRVYLCGAPKTVNALQRQCFLANASTTDIHCDAFVSAGDVVATG